MKRIQLIILSVAAFLLTGCRSDEPFRHVVFADSPEMFNFLMPAGRSVPEITEDVTYNIVFDDVKRNATLTITNLRVAAGDEGVMATFRDIEWTYEPGSHEKRRIITAEELNSDPSLGSAVTLTDVTIIYTETNEMNPEPSAGFYASYVLDGRCRVVAYPYSVYADGTTTVSFAADGMEDREIQYTPFYRIDFDPASMTASLNVEGLELEGQKVDFNITRLSLSLIDGGYELTGSDKTVLDSSEEDLTLRTFTATAALRNDLVINMILSFSGKRYEVEAILSPDLNLRL